MTVVKTRTFRSDDSEALRLPKEMSFGADVELTMIRSGDVLTVYPSRPSLQALIETLDGLPKPHCIETRDDQELPERPGL